MDKILTDNKWIGKRTIRPDGTDKVTGRATFGADFSLPGMLWGKVLRSPHPHAVIKSIKLEKAAALPGVKAVMRGSDLVDFPLDTPVMVGPADMRFVSRNVMARDKALYAGHAIAAVAAISPKIAQDALALIEVDYEVLPHVIDVEEAMKPDAPMLHDYLRTGGVVRYTAVQDAGHAIHPSYVEGQIQGGVAQGVGWALNEEYIYDHEGQLENPGFLDYRMPVASDLPMIDTVIAEVPNDAHPHGVRGVGEVPIVPPMAAVANAIEDAVGLRLTDLPMSPPKVLAALDAQA